MSTLDATVSMLEAMPEDARIKVMEFTQKLSQSARSRSFLTLPNHASRFPPDRGSIWKTH